MHKLNLRSLELHCTIALKNCELINPLYVLKRTANFEPLLA